MKKFQSAFNAEVCLTDNISGGIISRKSFNTLSTRRSASQRNRQSQCDGHIGFNPLSTRRSASPRWTPARWVYTKVSIRFQRGGLPHRIGNAPKLLPAE